MDHSETENIERWVRHNKSYKMAITLQYYKESYYTQPLQLFILFDTSVQRHAVQYNSYAINPAFINLVQFLLTLSEGFDLLYVIC